MPRIVGHELDKIYDADDEQFNLGDVVEDGFGRKYVFVQYESLSGSDGAAGLGCCDCDSAYDHWVVTCDSNHADAIPSIPRGQLQAALTNGKQGFSQFAGPSRKAATTDGSVAQGDELMLSSATRGVLTPKNTHRASFGTAKAADSTTTLAAGNMVLQIAL